MGAFIDITGERFGRLTVVGLHGRNAHKQTVWRCKCDCGEERLIAKTNLAAGTRSCGCLRRDTTIARSRKHGMKSRESPVPEYAVWTAMKSRCENERNKQYQDYGGRGITVCVRWRESFEAFIRDMGRRPDATMTLERRRNDRGYTPSNCYWASRETQANNKRSTTKVVYKGKRVALAPLCRRLGKDTEVVRWRLHHGWTLSDALTMPVQRGGRAYQGERTCNK